MSQTIKVRRGVSANLPATLEIGELAYTTDTQKLYVGTGVGRVLINSDEFTLPDVGTAGTYFKVTTDSKGRVTAGETTLATSDISGLGTAATKDTGTTSGTIPILGTGGKLNASVLPAIAISDTFVVATQTAMLALTAEVGDIAVRTDLSKSFILKEAGASTLANWQELLTPTDTVTSVAGKTGAVTLAKADVGLGNVDNTSDADKPISTATATALATKAPLASPTFTGTPKSTTAAADTNTTQIATTAFVIGQASSSAPLGLTDTATAGTSKKYARADHQHPMPTVIDGGSF